MLSLSRHKNTYLSRRPVYCGGRSFRWRDMRVAGRLLWVVALAIAVFAVSGRGVLAQTRHALVIGIDAYTHVAPLQKARNDAQAVAATLDAVGFDTDLVLDADQLDMATSLSRLSNRITPGDEVVFFFAGHGIEVDGRNYLLPADVPMAGPGQEIVLLSRSLEVATILDTLRAQGARISLLILDACRDNPFPAQGTRSLGGRRGLARVAAPEGTFVLFSAGDGQAALDRLSDDDPDPNSVFTRVLLPRLAQPGMPIHQLARDVRTEVRKLARQVDHDQFPAVYDQFDGEFALVPSGVTPPKAVPPANVPQPVQPDPAQGLCDRARADWALIAGLNDATIVRTFLAQYASCPLMVAIAQAQLAGLTAPPPVPTPVPDRPAPAPSVQAGLRVVAGDYRLPDSACYITVASRASIAETESFIRARLAGWSGLRVFQSNNGWFGITLETTRRADSATRLAQLVAQGVAPGDSYCSAGTNFVAEVHIPGLTRSDSGAALTNAACRATVVGIRPRNWGGNDSFLALRSQPSTQAAKVSELYLQDQVGVLERGAGWSRVQCLSGGCMAPDRGQAAATGWASERYLDIRCQ